MSGSPSQTNLVGHTLAGRYRLDNLLGAGGMGSVYQGYDRAMSDRVVAVKVLAPHLVSDEKQVLRFEQEARAANQLRHPNTISVLDFGRDAEGHIFMVIEFLTGETLTGILRHGRLDILRILYIFRQICKSLAEAHSKGIVHRDLKPDNIFVCEIYGESDFVKVIDFGIAKFLEEEGNQLTQAGKMFGTPRYLSPEQAQGKRLDARSDLYSLGVMLFECITGRPPFVAEEAIAVAIKHVQEAPPKMHEVAPDVYVPREVDRLVFKLLAKRPEDRFQSAEEVVAAIDEAMAAMQRAGKGLPVGSYTPHAAMTPARPSTIPPQSKGAASEDEATRALDVLGHGHLGDEEATRAFAPVAGGEDATRAMEVPQLRAPPAGGDGEATMALDTVAAQALAAAPTTAVRSGGPQGAARVAASAPPAAAVPADGGATQRLVLLLIAAVLVVGGVVAWALVTQVVDAPAAPTQPVISAAEAARQVEEAARAAAAKTAERMAAEARNKEAAADAKRPAGTTGAAAPTHALTLDSDPPGAEVVLDDGSPTPSLVLGKTPHVVQLLASDQERKYLLRMEGFDAAVVHVIPKTVVEARVARLPTSLKKKEAPKLAPKPTAPVKPKKPDWGM